MQESVPIGCVIMASGLSQRFGTNKLLADFCEQPMLCRAFAATDTLLLTERVVVTRSAEIKTLCEQHSIPVIFHTLSGRNDTVRLGLSDLLEKRPDLAGCMFLPVDQPLLTTRSVENLIRAFYRTKKRDICRLSYTETGASVPITGSPVLFDCSYFIQLLQLPEGKGGSVLLKRYPDHIQNIPAQYRLELADADTPQALAELEEVCQKIP